MFSFRLSLGRGPHRHTYEWPRSSPLDNQSGTNNNQSGTNDNQSRTNNNQLGTNKTTESQLVTLPQAQCYLFNIPTEIRLYIYGLVLHVQNEPVDVGNLSKRHLSILQTCRRILIEAEAIFYVLHRFQYSPRLFRIGLLRRDTITALTIVTSSGGSAFSAMEDLHLLPKLKSLYMQRQMSVRYLNVSEWSVMAKQMQDVLSKLQSLQEVKIFTPAASSELTLAEKTREEKLMRVDALLERDG